MHPKLLIANNGKVKLSVVDWWALGWGQPVVSYVCENEVCQSIEYAKEISLPDYTFVREGTTGYILTKKSENITVPVSDWVFGYMLDEHTLLWSVSYSPTYGKTLLIDLDTGKSLLQTAYIHPLYFEVVNKEVIMATMDNKKIIVFDLTEKVIKQQSELGLEKNFTFSPIAHSSMSSITFRSVFDGDRDSVCYINEDSCRIIFQEDVFSMAFSPNGRLFATYGADGFIRIWAVVPEGANVR
jgi:WD40 repeat protein